jgi:phenylacetate-CoA ligase
MFNQLNQKLGLPPPYIQAFLRFAAQHSPYYREQDWAKNLLAGLPIRLTDIPITAKATVLESPHLFRSDFDPPQAGEVFAKHTSGSTGNALQVFKSQSHFATNSSENMHLLEGWPIDKCMVQVVFNPPSDDHASGTIETKQQQNGIINHRIYTRSVDAIRNLVRKTQASFIAARPNHILGLLEDEYDYSFVRLVKTATETVPDELSLKIAALPDCRLIDLYGAVETGIIAMTCAHCGKYHLAVRNVHVEILLDDNSPASEGELGRIVATVFSNPAMPLIRYDLGDMVKVSTNSKCRAGAITLDRIYGRERMMFHLPTGERILPALSSKSVQSLGVKRFKLVQTSPTDIEFRYMCHNAHAVLDQQAVQNLVSRELSPQFRAVPVAVTEFPMAPSGKYLMHERLID